VVGDPGGEGASGTAEYLLDLVGDSRGPPQLALVARHERPDETLVKAVADHSSGGRLGRDLLLALGVLHLTHRASPTNSPAPAPPPSTCPGSAPSSRHCRSRGTSWTSATRPEGRLQRLAPRHPDERTQRELVERRTGAVLTDDIRNRVGAGDTTALTAAIINAAPSDTDLDSATWRHDPPAPDITQSRQLLDLASRQALQHFAGHHITPTPTEPPPSPTATPTASRATGSAHRPTDCFALPTSRPPATRRKPNSTSASDVVSSDLLRTP
jgi:hypothetical protein